MLIVRRASRMLAVGALLVSGLAFSGTSNCDGQWAAAGLCGVNNGSSLTISGTQQTGTPVSPAVPNTPGVPDRHITTTPGAPSEPAPPSERAIQLAACMSDSGTTRCAQPARPTDPTPSVQENGDSAAPAMPTITIADLARFAPPPVTVSADPGNVGIAGLPTNFLASTDVHVQTGELFGVPLTVRFSPTTYAYEYGDGERMSTATPGRTWAQLGEAQFTPTPTSHVYRDRGVYAASVSIRYAVEVDLGAGWITVPGEITTAGPPQQIRILEARTALVAHTCVEDPRGTGC